MGKFSSLNDQYLAFFLFCQYSLALGLYHLGILRYGSQYNRPTQRTDDFAEYGRLSSIAHGKPQVLTCIAMYHPSGQLVGSR